MKQRSAIRRKQNQSRETDIKFFAFIFSKIQDTSYIPVRKIWIFNNANATDVLSSNNGSCKWGRGGECAVYFHIPRKISGESTL